MIRIVVADDHEVVRKGIVTILNNAPDLQVIAEASDGAEAIEIIERERPDIAVVDISMPNIDGMAATKRISDLTAVVILSMHDDEVLVRQAFQFGARGYVLKNSLTEELLLAVRSADNGDAFLSPGVSQAIINECFSTDIEWPAERLTTREKEVLKLVCEGYTNAEIGRELFISPKTVEKHRKQCMLKLKVDSLPNLIREAVRHDLFVIEGINGDA